MNLSAGAASVAVALVLVGLKIWALDQTQALSIAASLADSGLDLMISVAGLAAIIYARRPPDDDHTFGHTSAEDLAALGQSLIILGSAGVIAWVAVRRLLSDSPPQLAAEGSGITVILISIVLTLALVAWQRRVAARTGNKVVLADSMHYVGDLLPNIGAVIALLASTYLDLPAVDSIVALGAAVFLVVGALNIGKSAWDALMDRAADPEILEGIERIARDWPGVHGIHDVQTRTAGSRVFVNMHVELDGSQTLAEAHDIGAAMKRAILKEFPQADIIIHKDPAPGTRPTEG